MHKSKYNTSQYIFVLKLQIQQPNLPVLENTPTASLRRGKIFTQRIPWI